MPPSSLRTDEAGGLIRGNAAAGKKLVRRQRLPREKISSGEWKLTMISDH